jgi:hypothetical protein
MKPTVSPQLLSGSELRRLLVLRSRLREAIVGVPRAVQREVLQAIETARQVRQEGRTRAWTPPEMTRDELIREIKWRLDAAGLDEVDAAARVIDRAGRRGRGPVRRGQVS